MDSKNKVLNFNQFVSKKDMNKIDMLREMLDGGMDMAFVLSKIVSAIPDDIYNNVYENIQDIKKYTDVDLINEEKGRLKKLVGKNEDEYLTSSDTLKLGKMIADMEGSPRRDHVGIINFLGASCRIHHEIKNSYLNELRSKVKDKAKSPKKEANKPGKEIKPKLERIKKLKGPM